MNIPVPQHGSVVGTAVQQLINYIVRLIALLIGWQIDSVSNIAAFATVDDTRIPDGSGKFVRTVKDTFHLDKTSAAVVDNITVVATMSGDGRWIRDLQPNAVWGSQATWYVDPLTGNDENTGATALVPLATFAEARRRLEPVGVLVATTIYIVSSLAATDLVGMNCGGELLTIQGLPTVLWAGEVLAYSKDAAANNPGHLSDAGWTVADVLHKHVLFTSGVAAGMGCWVMEDLGGGDSRVTTICNNVYSNPGTAVPVGGDTFVVQELPSVVFDKVVRYNGVAQVAYLSYVGAFGWNVGFDPQTSILSCSITSIYGGDNMTVVDCLSGFVGSRSGYLSIDGGGFQQVSAVRSSFAQIGSREITADGNVQLLPFSIPLVSVDKNSIIDSVSDIYLFNGAPTVDAISMTGWGTLKLSDGTKLRGVPTTARLATLYQSTHLAVFDRDNTVTEKTVRLQPLGNLDIELDTDTPVYDPHWDIRIGDGDYQTAAIGSKDCGVKGALTPGANVFALPDLTEGATEIPFVVTNRSFARNLRLHLGTAAAPAAGETVVGTVYVNGAPTAITATLNSGAVAPANTDIADVTHAVLVNPGDVVSINIVNSNNGGFVAADLSASLEVG